VNLRDAWEAQARNWEVWTRTPDHDSFWRGHADAFLDLVPAPCRLTLDLGCGEGRLARLLRERGHRVVGVDGAPTLARLAVGHEQPQPVAIADVAALPLRDRCADLAVAFMSLQDVDDMPAAVHEAARVLRPGAGLCLAIVHPVNSAGSFTGDDEDGPFVIERSYLDTFRYAEEVERDGLDMTFHSEHRPLEAYSRALEEAGFLVEAIREPPHPEDSRWRVEARWHRVPLFLHLRAVRR
jgi:SAM-dependent methyltransferase